MDNNVQFEEDGMPGVPTRSEIERRVYSAETKGSSSMVRFLKKINLVKTNTQAIVLAVVVALALLTFSGFFLQHALRAPQILELKVK